MSAASLKRVRDLARTGETEAALALTTELLTAIEACPYLLVLRARLIQVTDSDPSLTLRDAEACLLAALEVEPNYLPALEELAHYYDSVWPDPGKAHEYATRSLAIVEELREAMRAILLDANSEPQSPR